MTGADLVHQLWVAAQANGVTIGVYVKPLTSTPTRFIRQLREAHSPGPMTVERIRALIAGEPVPAPQSRAIERPVRPAGAIVREDLEWRRAIAEAAAERRLPGETLHSAVRRVEQELLAA